MPVRKRVVLELGQPARDGSRAWILFTWKPTFPGRLFPVMDGKAELAPVDPTIARLR